MLMPISQTTIILLVITTLATYHKYNGLTQNRIVIYSINNHSVYEFIDGKNQIIISDSGFINNPNKFDYHIKPSRAYWRLNSRNIISQGNDTIIDGFVKLESGFIYNGNYLIYCPTSDVKRNYIAMYSLQ